MPLLTLTQTQIQATIAKLNANEIDKPLDQAMIFAFCEIESSFNPFAYRYEDKLKEASWGLMQILESTAKDRGFNGEASELYDIETNLRFGLRQLAWIDGYVTGNRGRSCDPGDFAACYNAGVGNFLHGFLPTAYVQSFTRSFGKWSSAFGTPQTS